jgi:uncharacterized protein YuzE
MTEADVDSSYDYHNDVLYVRSETGSYHKSITVDKDLILDVDNEGQIIGFELHHASDAFNISKAHLRGLKGTRGNIDITENRVKLRISIITEARNNVQQRGTYNVNNTGKHSIRTQNQRLATT